MKVGLFWNEEMVRMKNSARMLRGFIGKNWVAGDPIFSKWPMKT